MAEPQVEALLAALIPKVVEQVQTQVLQVIQQQQQQAPAMPPNADQEMAAGSEADSEAELPPPRWKDVLSTNLVQPQHAQSFVQLLQQPPPLPQIKKGISALPVYAGIPQNPPSRKHRLDSSFSTVQQKIEISLHLLTDFLEKNGGDAQLSGMQSFVHSAAYLRSAWEDCHQNRRKILAGEQFFKLEPRQDQTTARLFTPEEDKNIRIFRPFNRPKPPAFPQSSWHQGFHQNRSSSQGAPLRGRSRSRDKGKGKGKGRGKGHE